MGRSLSWYLTVGVVFGMVFAVLFAAMFRRDISEIAWYGVAAGVLLALWLKRASQ